MLELNYIYPTPAIEEARKCKSGWSWSAEAMDDDGGEKSSFVIGLIENRAKEVLLLFLLPAISFCCSLESLLFPVLFPVNFRREILWWKSINLSIFAKMTTDYRILISNLRQKFWNSWFLVDEDRDDDEVKVKVKFIEFCFLDSWSFGWWFGNCVELRRSE